MISADLVAKPQFSQRSLARSDAWFYVALVCATIAALVTRLYDLAELPTGLFFDEAMNGLDALDTQQQTGIRLWIPDNFDRGLVAEGLLSHLQALAFSWFGVSIFSLRLPSVLAGAASVPLIGLLARELLLSRLGGAVAAFLAAFSAWAVLLSRQAYPAAFVPLCLAGGLYFFLSGARRRQTWRLMVGGIALGLGFYTYASFRIVPAIVAVTALLLLALYPVREVLRSTAITIGTAFLVALPMFWAMLVEPGLLTARAGSLSVLNTDGGVGAIVAELTRTTGLALAKYTGHGDENWRYNIAGEPLLDVVSGALFVAGIITLAWWIIRGIGRSRSRGNRTRAVNSTIAVVGFLLTLVPEIMANEGNPHALRSIGSQVFVFIIAAAPIAFTAGLMTGRGRALQIVTGTAVVALLVTMAWVNVQRFFVEYRASVGHHVNTQTYLRTMSEFLNASPPQGPFALVGLSLYDQAVIRFLAPEAFQRAIFVGSPAEASPYGTVIVWNADADTEQQVGAGRFLIDRRVIDLRPGTNSAFLVLRY